MSKTKIIVGIVALVIALGGYQVIYKNNNTDSLTTDSSSEVKIEDKFAETPKPEGKKMAFSQFLKQENGAYKCEVKQVLSDMENSGVVYINAGNLRGDYTTIAEGTNVDSHVIVKDGYSYNWSSALPDIGMKVKVQTSKEGEVNQETQGTYSWNADHIGEYNCEEWKVDESMFVLPTGIKFTTVN